MNSVSSGFRNRRRKLLVWHNQKVFDSSLYIFEFVLRALNLVQLYDINLIS